MPQTDPEAPIATQVRTLLASMPSAALPITYQQLASALGLMPPRTIQRVAQALEQLMKEDVAAGRPMIAALVVSRRGDGLPAPGFFQQAVALGRFPADPSQHEALYMAEREKALESRN
ncbi:hypothetical protein [Halomonas sp. HL-93]|uniref:hypothetical protein n=1 Tax=Halomonas sp. HL-93 TaxID=1666906 RepID=UPI0006DA2168|nr:hypothetical protein [Halomonas sp. HL-93]KPQ21092.1 MAG: hypothetical protein HLUCCO06_07645 [Halomonas sp. HL-93]SBR50547.1 hypothetical protein GA0071314_2734 [Halomonas sp. HL-93]